MLILWPHRFSIAPWFLTMFRLGLGAICLAVFCLGCFTIFIGNFTDAVVYRGVAQVPPWDFGMIDKGLIALRDTAREEASSLLYTLDVRAKNSRPDTRHNLALPQMLLEIKGSSRMRAAINGEKIFLHGEPPYKGEKVRNGPPAPLNWSAEPGFLSLTPFIFAGSDEGMDLFCQAVLTDEEGNRGQEIPILIEAKCSNSILGEKELWLEKLQAARFWTKDLFLDIYGLHRKELDAEVKISLTTKERPQIVCAKEGDFLVYQDDEWIVAPLEMATGKPLAKILKCEEDRLRVRVWDSSGFNSSTISLFPAVAVAIESKVETDFFSPRLRSSSAVSCLLGKRRVVLKSGDWWLHEENRSWRRLKRISEIDDFLAFRCPGEIFVIDNVDKSQGHSVLRGRLFDTTRQVMKIISLPIAEGRAKASTIKRHPHPRFFSSPNKKTDNAVPPREPHAPVYLGEKGEQ